MGRVPFFDETRRQHRVDDDTGGLHRVLPGFLKPFPLPFPSLEQTAEEHRCLMKKKG